MNQPQAVKLTVLPASSGDADFLFAVYASTRHEELAGWGWPPEQQQSFLKMQYNARHQSYLAAYPEAETNILAANDGKIGSMIVHRGPVEIRLVDIAVLVEHQGRGLGTKAIMGLIAEAEAARTPLRLSVLRGNRAARLYGRLGFVPAGQDPMYIEMEYRGDY